MEVRLSFLTEITKGFCRQPAYILTKKQKTVVAYSFFAFSDELNFRKGGVTHTPFENGTMAYESLLHSFKMIFCGPVRPPMGRVMHTDTTASKDKVTSHLECSGSSGATAA